MRVWKGCRHNDLAFGPQPRVLSLFQATRLFCVNSALTWDANRTLTRNQLGWQACNHGPLRNLEPVKDQQSVSPLGTNTMALPVSDSDLFRFCCLELKGPSDV